MPNPPKVIKSFLSRIKTTFGTNSKVIAPAFILLAILLIVGGYYLLQSVAKNSSGFTVSGTIEATEIHLGSEVGGKVDLVNVREGEKVTNGEVVVVVHGDKVHTPIDGVVLDRAVEPGEIVSPGTTLVTISNLDDLTLTVFVPEDHYGQIVLGQNCQVSVDSFPGRTFNGTVSHIAETAEFTPRNVQTTDSRKNTVFAIKLDMAPANGLLKPGMPADVNFQTNH
jgi:HlyD family secretion protein